MINDDMKTRMFIEIGTEVAPKVKKSFWGSMRTSTKFLILMLASSFLQAIFAPKGIIVPENVTFPNSICKLIWCVAALGWYKELLKEMKNK